MSSEVMFRAITGLRLVTADLERLTSFCRAMGFVTADAAPIAASEMMTLGLAGAGLRRPVTIGGSRVDLDSFDERGRSYPEGQPPAIVYFSISRSSPTTRTRRGGVTAWRRAREAGAMPSLAAIQ
jgi:hypothetical protein